MRITAEHMPLPGGPAPGGGLGTMDERYEARLHSEPAALAPLWHRLQREGACTAYQRFEWIGSLVRILADKHGARPLLIEVRRGGHPVMILPLVFLRRQGHRVIEALDLGACEYAAPVLAPGFDPSPEEAERIWRAVRAILPAADLIRFDRMPARVQGVANPLALLAGTRRLDLTASGFVLEGDPQTLLKRVCTPSLYKDLSRRNRRFDSLPGARFVATAATAEMDALFEVMIAQRRARFHELGRHEPLDRPGFVDFYRAAALAAPGGPVWMFGLWADGEWLAASYGLVHGGTFHGVLLTMAGDKWRSLAPGLLIAARIMVWAREQKLDYFDFTIGRQAYKRGFNPIDQTLFERAEPVTLRGRIALGLIRANASAKRRLERHPALFERARAGIRLLRRLRAEKS
ncbi:GNAT family N-acetyltransferase [Methylorubrum zatmanii]|uniref:GNAT family N-acetyltransferase n=1 Tax=Methylorubrum zatmanii TaxID=29429 RepID=A0ABW1WJ58_9HYPH|nr:GNAT family N-acetyltransferase [Methylorubrum zatmanii]MBD8905899.1 GNAT family N-acetyltransferase [Methylorubrum zatmanii]